MIDPSASRALSRSLPGHQHRTAGVADPPGSRAPRRSSGAISPRVVRPGEAGRERPRASGKFLYVGDDKLWVRGVTYGPFAPTRDGQEHRPSDLDRDFAQMAAHGMSAVRTYTVPPRWVLDAAQRHGLRVMVGLPWEQHVAFLDDRKRARSILERVRLGVRACAGHEAVLGYAIGNEIPASIVRWHGGRAIEQFLERLYGAAKAEDTGALMTYVNYPTTEYLELPFLDVVCFNVYLESEERFSAYLARLHNIAGERPLLLTEIGLDSRRHGEDAQAVALDRQVVRSFANGCAGVFLFAWTDEWHRGGSDIEDWDFGLTRRDRRPKPALATVRRAFADLPVGKDQAWPRISVVVCTYNGARTIRDCLEGLLRLEYPDVEVIVVNDGSTDQTAAIAREYGFGLITTENRGLSNARNTGLEAATGEIVAYLDDDARPDPHWLTYLALTFRTTAHVGVGGPNIAPPGDGFVADCVANAAGGPVHVLVSDTEAEHLPGCNMAFRRTALQAVGGFDPQFRSAGDDVDLCWRLRERGWTLGFCPAAVVWHHRRNTVRGYWRQQVGYGRAEAMLARKWPAKYNAAGHVSWSGRIYGPGSTPTLFARRQRIYHGTWGSAPFQRVYWPAPGVASSVLSMPEWWLLTLGLSALSALSGLWSPLRLAVPLLGLALGVSVLQAVRAAARAARTGTSGGAHRLGFLVLTALLHLLHPVARLVGRLGGGLTPWRGRRAPVLPLPRRRALSVWGEAWRAPGAWLESLAAALRGSGFSVLVGGPYDAWDLEVLDGTLGSVRLRMGIEEHGAGRQLLRFRLWPRWSGAAIAVAGLCLGLGGGAALDRAWAASALLLVSGLHIVVRALRECGAATGAVVGAVSQLVPAADAATVSLPPLAAEYPRAVCPPRAVR